MRQSSCLALLLALSLTSFGCEKGTTQTGTSSTGTADKKAAEARDKISDAVDATIAAAQAKRDEYAVEMGKRLDELDVKFAELKARSAKAEGAMKVELEKQVAEAKVKRDAAAAKLDELKTASAERWEKIKDGVGTAFDDLKKAFE